MKLLSSVWMKVSISALLGAAVVVAPQTSAYAGPFDNCDYPISLNDGQFEFVWKPTGAHRPQAVLVLPSRFRGYVGNTRTTTVRSATLYRADTLKRVGTVDMKSTGALGPGTLDCKPGGECLNRPTFAHPSLSGASLKRKYGNLRIRVQSNVGNHVHCTKAFNPKVRYD